MGKWLWARYTAVLHKSNACGEIQMRLYYLTNEIHALSNLEKRRLKISRFSTLNDPFELMPVKAGDPKHRRAIYQFKKQIDKDKGLICFSKTWENPVLWGHYGDKHKGIALGLEVEKSVANRVIYSNKLIDIPVDPITHRARPDEKLVNSILRTKSKDWRYEDEWRVFFELKNETAESGLYFSKFFNEMELKEVVLGPNCTTTSSKVASLLKNYTEKIQITKARIAFNSFRVFKDQSALTIFNR